MHRHLTVPNDVATADDSQELIRVFAASGQLHVALAWDAWPDASPWGVLLADLARHVANAREQRSGVAAAQSLADIRLAFEEAWSWDAQTVEGQVDTDG